MSNMIGIRLRFFVCVPMVAGLIACNKGKLNIMSHVSDSPIVVSGGSMTFRALKYWTCDNSDAPLSTHCYSPASNLSTITSDDLLGSSGNWASDYNIGGPWTIKLFPRDKNGKTSGAAGVSIVLCSTSAADFSTNCSGSGYVRIFVTGGPALLTSNAKEPSVAGSLAIQYFDPACQLHGTTNGSSDKPPSAVYACEHPGNVTFADGSPYTCVNGMCRIVIK